MSRSRPSKQWNLTTSKAFTFGYKSSKFASAYLELLQGIGMIGENWFR